jgi:hypothetical protein
MSTKKTEEKKPAAKEDAKENAKDSSKNKRLAALVDSIRRPDPGIPPTASAINTLVNILLMLMGDIDDFIVNMRALDRKRHNGVGVKRLGFIETALRIATNFPQYYPHWLTTPKFRRDVDLFSALRSLVEACRSLEEKVWNLNVEAADMAYTDALEYYSQVQDASERRIDAADALYAELNVFFRNMGPHGTEDQPTEMKVERDAVALLHGRKDGEVIIKNTSPKTISGSREVVDETYKSSASFKETEKGEIKE